MTGAFGNTIDVESSGSNYFSITDDTQCALTSFEIQVNEGDAS